MRGDTIVSRLFGLPPAWRSQTAFASADGRLDFETLRAGTMGVAGWLAQSAGVGPRERVAICLPKNLEAIQIIFGILAAGVTYVPLQFEGPPARLAAVLESVNPRLLLTTEEMAARLGKQMGEQRLPRTEIVGSARDGQGLAPMLAGTTPASTIAAIDPGDVAVIVFTSGSTGEPKGAMLSHRSLVIRTTPPFVWDEVLATDRLIVNAGLHYVSSLNLFFPAVAGCMTYLLSDQEAMFPDRIVDLMESDRTTIWKSSATALQLLTEKGRLEGRRLQALRRIDFVGEPLPVPVLRRAMDALPHTTFLHRFGATEAYRIADYPVPRPLPADLTVLPLGKPDANYRLILLGDDDREVKPGERGEICVIGPPVTLGYWKDPELTAAKRFEGRPDSFRTGDLARLDEDGLLHWVGRRDQVIKIRGHRIDLGEIEAVLRSHDAVDDCVAFAFSNGDGQAEIRAAVLTQMTEELESDLKLLCVKHLQAQARPASFLPLAKFPLLHSGKVDRQAIRALIEAA